MSASTGLVPGGLRWFDRTAAPAPRTRPDPRTEDEASRDRRLFCAFCHHPITHLDERIEVGGRHRHRCTNPGGYTFEIGCFRAAVGCIANGIATEAHTWFRGYAWRVALCASCERQLGWRFEAPTDCFHGLILDRVTSAEGSP
jgi:hypothetical protein